MQLRKRLRWYYAARGRQGSTCIRRYLPAFLTLSQACLCLNYGGFCVIDVSLQAFDVTGEHYVYH